MTGTPAFVNLHIHSGLANGISLLSDAYDAGTPLVLTAGNIDIRKVAKGRIDLTEMVATFTKWAAEVSHPEQVSNVLRRAFAEAKAAPSGPVFVSFSANALDGEGEHRILPSADAFVETSPAAVAIADAVQILAGASRPVIAVGNRLAQSGGVAEAVRVAKQIGARVFSVGYTQMVFPTAYPQYMGMLSLRSPAVREELARADAVLAVGARPFVDFFYHPDPPLAERAKLLHIDSSGGDLSRSEPTDLAILADPRAAMVALADALEAEMSGSSIEAAKARAMSIAAETRAAQQAFEAGVKATRDQRPMTPGRMMTEIAGSLPSDAVVIDDAISSRGALYSAIKFSELGSVQGEVGAAIGWGMGAALGVKLAERDRPVVAIVGDGSAMMTVQALWTAANMRLPVVYLICNNGMYRVLKLNMSFYLHEVLNAPTRESEYMGMDFPLRFDFAKIAGAFGLAGRRIEGPGEIGPALAKAIDSDEPTVLDVVIDGSL